MEEITKQGARGQNAAATGKSGPELPILLQGSASPRPSDLEKAGLEAGATPEREPVRKPARHFQGTPAPGSETPELSDTAEKRELHDARLNAGAGADRQAAEGERRDDSAVSAAEVLLRTQLAARVLPTESAPALSTQAKREEQERMMIEHLPIVRFLARRIHERLPQHVDLEDLVSAG